MGKIYLSSGPLPAIDKVGEGREDEGNSQQRPTQPALHAHNLQMSKLAHAGAKWLFKLK